VSDLLDVVYQGEQLPLGIDLGLAAQREAFQALVLEVGEHRFDDGDALVEGEGRGARTPQETVRRLTASASKLETKPMINPFLCDCPDCDEKQRGKPNQKYVELPTEIDKTENALKAFCVASRYSSVTRVGAF
jgi:hypothetical protein